LLLLPELEDGRVSSNTSRVETPTAPSPAPGTEGLNPLDKDRAASLADEGGVSAATTETQEVELARGPSMLFELSITPLGDVHLSDEIAQILEVIDRSGLPYQLTPGSTYIEGSWDEVLPIIRACHESARRSSRHVITSLRIEDDAGEPNKIRRNVESVQDKTSADLETSL
jgi:uncharacterized protein (TIGR00106 family)